MLSAPVMIKFISIIDALALASIIILTRAILLRKKSPPPPPGPRAPPIIGNLLDLPQSDELEAVHWEKHKELYGKLMTAYFVLSLPDQIQSSLGPISSVTTFGNTLIIVNDANIASELLDKRSAIYSSRPLLTFAEL